MIKSPIFLAVALLLLTLAFVGYQAFELNKIRLGKALSVNEPQQRDQKKQNAAANSVPNFTQLATRDLMGDPKKAPKKPTTENVVPITALKLVLMGTIIKTEGGTSSALIQGNNKDTKRYYIGEMVEGGFTLTSVTVDSAILKRNDQLETLTYPLNAAASMPIPAPVSASAPQPEGRTQQQNAAAASAAKFKSLRERMRDAQANKNAQKNPADK